MHGRLRWIASLIILSLTLSLSVFGQEDNAVDCSREGLEAFIRDGTADLTANEGDPAYHYRLGDLYTRYALLCGYSPSMDDIERQIDRTLELAPLSFIIAATSIGDDVDEAMAELETVDGDSFAGQLLYNGLEPVLDGTELGCAGCHNGEAAPPLIATYTRVEEQRLTLPEFEGYSVEQYLVESILNPASYIVPGYEAVMMPHNYGTQLDAQQLADLIAYLESQDQLIEDAASTGDANTAGACDAFDSSGCENLLATYTGDPTRGQALYVGGEPASSGILLGCAGCHTGAIVGPATDGTWTRVVEERLTLPQFAEYSPERYLAESIFMPDRYIVEGYPGRVMLPIYAEQMSLQDLADVIAYLRETTQ